MLSVECPDCATKGIQPGMPPIAVREAVEDWVNHRAGPTAHDRGLAAFYKQDFAGAARE